MSRLRILLSVVALLLAVSTIATVVRQVIGRQRVNTSRGHPTQREEATRTLERSISREAPGEQHEANESGASGRANIDRRFDPQREELMEELANEAIVAGLRQHGQARFKALVDFINAEFRDESFGEVPANAHLEFLPQEGLTLKGRLVHYHCTREGEPLPIEEPGCLMIDYGPFTTTIEKCDHQLSTFQQRISFERAEVALSNRGMNYSPSGAVNWLLQGERDGRSTHLTEQQGKPNMMLFFDCQPFQDKPLKKGDVYMGKLSRLDGQEVDDKYEVLGYRQVAGRRCIVVQREYAYTSDLTQTIPEFSGSSALTLERHTQHRLYYDMDMRLPMRAEIVVDREYSPNCLEEPYARRIFGAVSPRDPQIMTRTIYQLHMQDAKTSPRTPLDPAGIVDLIQSRPVRGSARNRGRVQIE